MTPYVRNRLYTLLVAAGSLAPTIGHAELFNLSVSANGQTYTTSFDDAEDSIQAAAADAISEKITAFDENTDSAQIVLDYRGLDMQLAYGSNSTSLEFQVASLGINKTFAGATRSESNDQLVDFLKSDGGDLLNRIMKELAAVSPTDPIAGNPASLMSMEAASLFDSATQGTSLANKEAQSDVNQVDFNIRFSNYQVDEEDVQQLHLPLSYTVNIDGKPGHQLHFKLPLSYTKVNSSAESYGIGLGIGYTFPVNGQLSFTPGVSYAAIGSVNQGAAAAVQTLSLSTKYDFSFMDQEWRFGNTLARMSTAEVKFDDYEIDPNLTNHVMVNGLQWRSVPIEDINLDLFVTDTRFFGDELYSERTDEIGFSIASENLMPDSVNKTGLRFRVGGSYLVADRSDINGFRINMGASF